MFRCSCEQCCPCFFCFLKDPACQNISTELHCYLLDPFCLIQSTLEETTKEVNETSTHEMEKTSYEEKDNIFILVASLSSSFILVLLMVVLKKKYFRKKGMFITFNELRMLLIFEKSKPKPKAALNSAWKKMCILDDKYIFEQYNTFT